MTASRFSPYLLFRRGALAYGALAGMVPERTWSLLDEADALDAASESMRIELEESLYRIIPDAPADERRWLLRMRRDIHNGRVPARPERPGSLPLDFLDKWARARSAAEGLRSEAAATFAEELAEARAVVAEAAANEDFRRGLQLSGAEAYAQVTAFVRDIGYADRKPSRRRRMESTITSLAYRMVFKPSPFGSFAEVGAGPWEVPAGADGRRVRLARISVGLVRWIAQLPLSLDGADAITRVRLNNSLATLGDRVVYIRRPIEGFDDNFAEDRVIAARPTALIRLLVEAMGTGEIGERDLLDRLGAAGLPPAEAKSTVDQLVRAGLCHRGLGLPDQAVRVPGRVAEILRTLGTVPADRCAEIFDRVQRIEDTYPTAGTDRRTALLADLREAIDRLVEVCGAKAPPDEALRTMIYEDTGTRGSAHSWHPGLLERNAARFALLQRLAPVMDDGTVERLGMYRLFTQRYGGADVPLVEFYRTFAELPAERLSEMMSGAADPAAERVTAARRALFDEIRGQLANAGDDLVLDEDRLRRFADALPEFVSPWRSAAYRIQIDRGRAVVNGIATGHGAFYSRFCDLLEPGVDGAWSLRRAVLDHLTRSNPRQADLTAVLGLNFNLHPRLTPFEVVYPGSLAAEASARVLTLAGLVVRPDPMTRRLCLISAVDDQPIDLVPLNFLFPAAAPRLYRFLCAFGPVQTFRGGLWDQLDRAGADLPAYRPRVLLGDLVLDRRSWWVERPDLPEMAGLERQSLPAMAAFDRWRRAHDIPRHTFFRPAARPAPPGRARDLAEETRKWALEARHARLRKPHFLDSRDPYLLAILARQLGSSPETAVRFQECLPDAAGYLAPGGPSSAEEFVVEFNLADPGGHD
jgi:hypothetical protein